MPPRRDRRSSGAEEQSASGVHLLDPNPYPLRPQLRRDHRRLRHALMAARAF